MTRIFYPYSLTLQSDIILTPAASHHLISVLRVKLNDYLTIFNGQGGEFSAKIHFLNKKQVGVKLIAFHEQEIESPLNITLAQSISRGEKMDFTLQKSVELGVKNIIPLFTERCTIKLDKKRLEKKFQHWQNILISACEQCGRNRVPTLLFPEKFMLWIESLPIDIQKFILTPSAEYSFKHYAISSLPTVVLIGPEGGFSPAEIQLALKKNFLPTHLGPRILRTETTALVALTLLQAIAGDL